MKTFILALLIAFLLSLVLTPIVKKIAIKMGAIDLPDERKVHKEIMPRMGGLAIYLAFVISYLSLVMFDLFEPVRFINAFLIGSTIVVATGVIDDKYQISPKQKLLGQIIAAFIVVFYGGKVDLLNIPLLDGAIQLGWLAVPITILWIIGVTNAINLIDGLDGLAAGVSAIAATSLFFVAISVGNMVIALITILLVGSIVGFLYFNFHPAKIFMGDTGSLFLGFSLASLSLLEFKQVTIVSFIIPILILGVPISDTLYAMLRRYVNNQPMTAPDKNHLHHRFLKMGFSHRNAVLVIYLISIVFGFLAVLLTQVALWLSIIIALSAIIVMELIAESIGLVNEKKFKPLLSLFKRK